jgi:ribose transport system permease protein
MSTQTTNTTGAADSSIRSQRERTWRIGREVALIALIIVIVVISSIFYPAFLTIPNFAAILRNLAFDGIMAVGMMLLMIGGTFDLSVGGMFSLASVLTGWFMMRAGIPVPLAILLGLGVGALGGFINGFVIARIKVNALITTLGTMGIFRGIAVLVGGPGITNLPTEFSRLAQFEFPRLITTPIYLFIFLVILFHYFLSRTRFFRQLYYIGGNQKAATLSGINVQRMQIIGYIITGFLAALAGIAFSSRVGTAVSISGDGAELRVITAVILGGASLNGGKGSIWGALIGVLFIAIINNLLIVAQIPSTWQGIVVGVVLVIAVAMDSFLNRD